MAESIIKPRILKGFRDSLPQDERQKKDLTHRLITHFESFGYVPIDTPSLEYTEVLLGKGGGETDKQVYRFEDKGGRDVSLRFDLTVPFARYMAQHRNELYRPFRRYHIDKVWRGENTQKGRYREFTQCDFDLVGLDKGAADFEILLMMARGLETLEIGDFAIHLSHRGLFNQLLSSLNLQDKSVEILRTVDKLSKIGREKVEEELLKLSASAEATQRVLAFIESRGTNTEVLAQMMEAAGIDEGDEEKGEGARRLKEILAMADEVGIANRLVLDPSITRGLDYYTGIVYETFLSDLRGIGSVCSGGRYNNLAGLYSKEALPGVGASVGLDRLLAALEELNRLPNRPSSVDLLIINMDAALQGHYQYLADQFRREGFHVEVYPETKKMGAQFKLAETKGIPAALICGSEEHSRKEITLKDLQKRENHSGLSLEEGIEKLKTLKP